MPRRSRITNYQLRKELTSWWPKIALKIDSELSNNFPFFCRSLELYHFIAARFDVRIDTERKIFIAIFSLLSLLSEHTCTQSSSLSSHLIVSMVCLLNKFYLFSTARSRHKSMMKKCSLGHGQLRAICSHDAAFENKITWRPWQWKTPKSFHFFIIFILFFSLNWVITFIIYGSLKDLSIYIAIYYVVS